MATIKTHLELADHIAGKKILHLNSLGKDSIAILEWLANFASPAKVISLNYSFLAKHPADDRYLNYLRKRYPHVEFITFQNPTELAIIAFGMYQSPMAVTNCYNWFEYSQYEMPKVTEDFRQSYACDYVCYGQSKYESFARATKFYKQGLLIKHDIFPLGLMTKDQIYAVLKKSGVKLHPCYKLSKTTHDQPNYWKMRSALLASPEYRATMYKWFPLLRLDVYRYEKLLGK